MAAGFNTNPGPGPRDGSGPGMAENRRGAFWTPGLRRAIRELGRYGKFVIPQDEPEKSPDLIPYNPADNPPVTLSSAARGIASAFAAMGIGAAVFAVGMSLSVYGWSSAERDPASGFMLSFGARAEMLDSRRCVCVGHKTRFGVCDQVGYVGASCEQRGFVMSPPMAVPVGSGIVMMLVGIVMVFRALLSG